VEQLFFYKGLISDLILLGTANKQVVFSRKSYLSFIFTPTLFLTKKSLQKNIASRVTLPSISWVQNNLNFFSHNSEHNKKNQDTTLIHTPTAIVMG